MTPAEAGIVPTGTRCKHGAEHYCGTCTADAATKCKHGRPFYCGLCWAETGNGAVPQQGAKP